MIGTIVVERAAVGINSSILFNNPQISFMNLIPTGVLQVCSDSPTPQTQNRLFLSVPAEAPAETGESLKQKSRRWQRSLLGNCGVS